MSCVYQHWLYLFTSESPYSLRCHFQLEQASLHSVQIRKRDIFVVVLYVLLEVPTDESTWGNVVDALLWFHATYRLSAPGLSKRKQKGEKEKGKVRTICCSSSTSLSAELGRRPFLASTLASIVCNWICFEKKSLINRKHYAKLGYPIPFFAMHLPRPLNAVRYPYLLQRWHTESSSYLIWPVR